MTGMMINGETYYESLAAWINANVESNFECVVEARKALEDLNLNERVQKWIARTFCSTYMQKATFEAYSRGNYDALTDVRAVNECMAHWNKQETGKKN